MIDEREIDLHTNAAILTSVSGITQLILTSLSRSVTISNRRKLSAHLLMIPLQQISVMRPFH